jgi:hypothetical protein
VVRNTDELAALSAYARDTFDTGPDVLAPVLDGLRAQVEGRHADAVELIRGALPQLERIGGSLAQRSVIDEALLRSLVECGRLDEARRSLAEQMDAGRAVHWVPRELSDLVR